ncbi:sulfate adenylyltransferase subunit CysN [Nesterenkonia haasae]|uniref:sulfate adenylyltransferase subunit CysN n=1 Tax=Nesterenkonia haasae TaxID=2587813 RepID=UPI0013913FEB|nr:sulfate adenylyltransferase subunit CysN [Nesterenkonia haasae]NDK33190.1 sulfate adenylyltransferase subunit CysN [Nesterenkonia haasae]
MSHKSALIAEDIGAYLKEHENKDLLRFITCGSVDDGKSTLIGRLLFDSKMIYEDQLAAVTQASKSSGTQGERPDLALLVDGLQSEREQGITIDVAYRFFSTEKRKFIIADTPGHEQYTRNMATGASTASLAIILVDARHGVMTQTRRHSFIADLLGIEHLVIAVNKMDLVEYSMERFNEIVAEYGTFATNLQAPDIHFVPISALEGDNVVGSSANMSWFSGEPLLELLESVPVAADHDLSHLRLPIQYVNRPNLDFRGYAGTLASGVLTPGQKVKVLPSGTTSQVERIVTWDGDLDAAYPEQAITVTLTDDIDISRGDWITSANAEVTISNTFEADIVWMHETQLQPGKLYDLKIAAREISGSIENIEYQIDVNTLERRPVETLELNAIARCQVELTGSLPLDEYRTSPRTGSFIVIDRLTNLTVGAGMIRHVSERESPYEYRSNDSKAEVVWHRSAVTQEMREQTNGHSGKCIWFTGLSGSGKSTLANALEVELHNNGYKTMLLDGDNVRQGLCKDLGMTETDREENIRRVSEVARLFTEAGIIVLTAFVSPYRRDREMARELFGPEEFIEIFVDTPLELCEERDPKGLYQKARRGEIRDFTGVSAPYEAPRDPELIVRTDKHTQRDIVRNILNLFPDKL